MHRLKQLKKTLKPIFKRIMTFFWIFIIVYNLFNFIACLVVFVITKDTVYITSFLEISVLISIGISGLVEVKKDGNY